MIGLFNFRNLRDRSKRFYMSTGGSTSQLGEGGKNCLYLLFILACITLQCMDTHPNPGPTNTRRPKICHANIYSLDCDTRFESIQTQLAGKYEIITLSETWLESTDQSSKFILNGYNGPFRLDRRTKGGGGVLAWVTEDLVTKRRQDLETRDLETMFLDIRSTSARFILGVAYRQPAGHYADLFWESLQESMDKVRRLTWLPVILIGDFNADPNNKPAAEALELFMDTNSLTQHITEPTRITPTSDTKLDLILTNTPELIKNPGTLIPVDFNDHDTVFGTINIELPKQLPYHREMWDFKNANFNMFREELASTDWEHCFTTEDPNLACEAWNEKFLNIANKHVNTKTVLVRPQDCPWYNNNLRRLARDKHRARMKARRTGTATDWAAFRTSRNTYKEHTNQAKFTYENTIVQELANKSLTSPKRWWDMTKKLLGFSRTSYPSLIEDDRVITSDQEKAQAFNEFSQCQSHRE